LAARCACAAAGDAAVGFLRVTSPTGSTHLVAAFQRGLREMGFIEAQNVAIAPRSA
jgi:hypothetical protein